MPTSNRDYTYKYYANSKHSTRISHEQKVKREQAIDAFLAGMPIEDATQMGEFPSRKSLISTVRKIRNRGLEIPKARAGTWANCKVNRADTSVNENGRVCYSDEVRNQALQLRERGHYFLDIAKALGIGSSRTIRDWVKQSKA
jgi:transposase-like protein